MNADSADTRYPHLDLDDLIAGAAGQPVHYRAREHLANCEHCQRVRTGGTLLPTGSEVWQPAPRRRPSPSGRRTPLSMSGARGDVPSGWSPAWQQRSSCSSG